MILQWTVLIVILVDYTVQVAFPEDSHYGTHEIETCEVQCKWPVDHS